MAAAPAASWLGPCLAPALPGLGSVLRRARSIIENARADPICLIEARSPALPALRAGHIACRVLFTRAYICGTSAVVCI